MVFKDVTTSSLEQRNFSRRNILINFSGLKKENSFGRQLSYVNLKMHAVTLAYSHMGFEHKFSREVDREFGDVVFLVLSRRFFPSRLD